MYLSLSVQTLVFLFALAIMAVVVKVVGWMTQAVAALFIIAGILIVLFA